MKTKVRTKAVQKRNQAKILPLRTHTIHSKEPYTITNGRRAYTVVQITNRIRTNMLARLLCCDPTTQACVEMHALDLLDTCASRGTFPLKVLCVSEHIHLDGVHYYLFTK